MPLALNQSKGRLTAEAYGRLHKQVLSSWGLRERANSDPGSFTREKHPLILGGGSDFGPGLCQVYQDRFGVPDLDMRGDNELKADKLIMFGPCSSHGISNIMEAACKLQGEDCEENSPKDYLEEMTELIKLLKRRCTLENLQEAVKISFPRTFKSKKWTSLKDLFNYFLRNWTKLESLKDTNLDILTGGGGGDGYDSSDSEVEGEGDDIKSTHSHLELDLLL